MAAGWLTLGTGRSVAGSAGGGVGGSRVGRSAGIDRRSLVLRYADVAAFQPQSGPAGRLAVPSVLRSSRPPLPPPDTVLSRLQTG